VEQLIGLLLNIGMKVHALLYLLIWEMSPFERFRCLIIREIDVSLLYLSVLRDCLCMMYGHDVWIMKEYGNEES
jgi:hypothetical protein